MRNRTCNIDTNNNKYTITKHCKCYATVPINMCKMWNVSPCSLSYRLCGRDSCAGRRVRFASATLTPIQISPSPQISFAHVILIKTCNVKVRIEHTLHATS